MDGPHDLGGKDGFGPVDANAPPFRHDWERRQWALSNTLRGGFKGTIDWWRHGIEAMEPATYLSLPYFAKWNANELAHMIDEGVLTMGEVQAGHATEPAPPAPALSPAECDAAAAGRARSFAAPVAAPPAFATGD